MKETIMEAKPICLIRFFLDRFFCVYSEHTIRTLLENPCSTCAYQQEKKMNGVDGKNSKASHFKIYKNKKIVPENCKLTIVLTFTIYLYRK